jgi:hypothetical protein
MRHAMHRTRREIYRYPLAIREIFVHRLRSGVSTRLDSESRSVFYEDVNVIVFDESHAVPGKARAMVGVDKRRLALAFLAPREQKVFFAVQWLLSAPACFGFSNN